MAGNVQQIGAAVCCRLAFAQAIQRLERAFQSQTPHRLLLPRCRPEWHPTLDRPPQHRPFARRLQPLICSCQPNGTTTAYVYNAVNEQTSVTNETCGCIGKSGTTTYDYNAVGQQTSVTDPLGNVTTSTYNAQGAKLTEIAPNGTISYSYDLVGNQTSITDPDNNATTYSYNAANQLVGSTNPQGYASTNTYNAGGLLTATTDADGRTIDYSYNAAGQETSATWVGGNYTATYDYNANGELTSASDLYSTYTYTYNALGQETSASNAGTPGVPTVTLSYGYDTFGNRTSLTDSLGGSLSYVYNAAHEMTSLGLSVSSTLDAQVTFAYDGAGNLTGMTRTAPSVSGFHTIATSLSYNHSNELTNIADTDATASVTLANYTYGYNTAGVLTSYQDNSGNSLTYGYDHTDQLTSASGTLNGSSYGVSYTYDANGNRTMSGYVTGTGNELTSDGVYNYTYDNNGNTLTQTEIATGSVTYYSWDYKNRLTEVKVEDSHGTVLNDEQFTYDVFGNRIGVLLNGTQQLYTVYDGSNPYMDFNGSGTLTERYLTNPKGLSQFYGQVSASGTTEWFLTDNLGSVRQVVNTTGTALDVIIYDPFGNIVNQTNSANAPRFLYTGGAYDPITGTYLDGVREDNPRDARWESPDPTGLGPDSNPYRYVDNNPESYVDQTGLAAESVEAILQQLGAGWKLDTSNGKLPYDNLEVLNNNRAVGRLAWAQPTGFEPVYVPAGKAGRDEITFDRTMPKPKRIKVDWAIKGSVNFGVASVELSASPKPEGPSKTKPVYVDRKPDTEYWVYYMRLGVTSPDGKQIDNYFSSVVKGKQGGKAIQIPYEMIAIFSKTTKPC